jgi:formylglycine-generating enzyme required for sulfatase activity
MVFVEGGTFTMGCTPEQGKNCAKECKTSIPAHEVTLDGFYIGKYEVTQTQWEEVMGNNPSRFKGKNKPVESVNWNDTQKFIRKLNQKTGLKYRLPTEAEWEYAARGGNQSKGYKYSGGDDLKEIAWNGDNANFPTWSKYGPGDAGTKKANELGIHDMSGNVREWVQDFYGPYNSEPQTNPKGPETAIDDKGYYIHILRGGGWNDYLEYMSIVYRTLWHLNDRHMSDGFRLALDKNDK